MTDSRATLCVKVRLPRDDEDAAALLLRSGRARGGLLREAAAKAAAGGGVANGREVGSRCVVTTVGSVTAASRVAVNRVNRVNRVDPWSPARIVLVITAVVEVGARRGCLPPASAPGPADVLDEAEQRRDGSAADGCAEEAAAEDAAGDEQNESEDAEDLAGEDQLVPRKVAGGGPRDTLRVAQPR